MFCPIDISPHPHLGPFACWLSASRGSLGLCEAPFRVSAPLTALSPSQPCRHSALCLLSHLLRSDPLITAQVSLGGKWRWHGYVLPFSSSPGFWGPRKRNCPQVPLTSALGLPRATEPPAQLGEAFEFRQAGRSRWQVLGRAPSPLARSLPRRGRGSGGGAGRETQSQSRSRRRLLVQVPVTGGS